MSTRPQIDDPQGVKDPRAVTILRSIKQVIDSITGRAQGVPTIPTVAVNANLYGVIYVLNLVVNRIQSGQSTATPPKASGARTLTVVDGLGYLHNDGSGAMTYSVPPGDSASIAARVALRI